MSRELIAGIKRSAESSCCDFICQEAYREAICELYPEDVAIYKQAYGLLLDASKTCLERVELETEISVSDIKPDEIIDGPFHAFVFSDYYFDLNHSDRFWVKDITLCLQHEVERALEAENWEGENLEQELQTISPDLVSIAQMIDEQFVTALYPFREYKNTFYHRYSPTLFFSIYDYRDALHYFHLPFEKKSEGLCFYSAPYTLHQFYRGSFGLDNSTRKKLVPKEALSRTLANEERQFTVEEEHLSAWMALEFCGSSDKVELIDWVNMSVDVSRPLSDNEIKWVTAWFKQSLYASQANNIRAEIQCATSIEEIINLNKLLESIGGRNIDETISLYQSNNLNSPPRSKIKNYLCGMILHQDRSINPKKLTYTELEQNLAAELSDLGYGIGFSDESIRRGFKLYKEMIEKQKKRYLNV
ncbi:MULTISPECIES: hypothetical protein [Vibrio harveyi group]|uniref:hypothetical protein n=2 Tax=Vibrio TaxID=662 RepID=UPI00111F27DC|nr:MULTISPECIES: hypothetical protein [Vibrio harveyi group]MBE4244832.1 hypothetical protein [Vibrio parahaemolyticus]TOK37488.1 hypothetical protein CGI20_15890 [Vibrio parahaemolyticus]WEK81871.1 hypothetical protein PY250_23450 [Vibrio alginolyticus]